MLVQPTQIKTKDKAIRSALFWVVTPVCLMALSGCNFSLPSIMGGDKQTTIEPPPKDIRRAAPKTVPLDDARDLSKSASKSEGFGTTPVIQVNNDKASQLKAERENALFDTKISNTKKRFDRLENVVAELHTDFKSLKPQINRLTLIENDLDDLMDQLTILVDGTTSRTAPRATQRQAIVAPARIQPAPAVAPPAQTTPKTAAQKTMPKAVPKALPSIDRSQPIIHNIRAADYAGKTRLVFENAQNLKYMASLDKSENLLTLTFDKAIPRFNADALKRQSKIIESVTTADTGGQTLVAIALKRSANLGTSGRIKPNKDSAYHRIFMDLTY